MLMAAAASAALLMRETGYRSLLLLAIMYLFRESSVSFVRLHSAGRSREKLGNRSRQWPRWRSGLLVLPCEPVGTMLRLGNVDRGSSLLDGKAVFIPWEPPELQAPAAPFLMLARLLLG